MLRSVDEYRQEISRVQAAIYSKNSDFLLRDYGKYKKRLVREMKKLERWRG